MDGARTDRVSAEQHVSWLELFFDLVFVAWLSLVNSTLLENEHPSLLLGFYAAFGAFTIWMLVSVVNNRYPDQRIVRTGSMVVLMLLTLLIALTLQPEDGLPNSLGAVLLGGVYLTIAVMVLDVRRRIPQARVAVPVGLLVVAAGICFARSPTIGDGPGELYRLGDVAVLGTVLAAGALGLLATSTALPGYPLRPRHLDERWGQVIIIVLGEGILVLGEVVLGYRTIPNPVLFVVLFLAMFGFWRLYFDSAMRSPVEESAPVFAVLAVCHLLLIFGLMTAVDFLAQGVGIGLPLGDDYVLGGAALALVFGSLATIAAVRRRGFAPIVGVNLLVAVVFLVLGFVGEATGVSLTGFIAVCLAIVILYAAFVRIVDPQARPLIGARANT